MKSFKLANYVKLRCQKVGYNKKLHKFQFLWKDSETSRNGRKLLSLVQDVPQCPDKDFTLKIYEGEEWSRFRCLKKTEKGNQKLKIWKEPVFTPLSNKQLRLLGFKNKDDKLPHCPKGWILRDFDMGDWIKIKCFQKVVKKKKVCTQHKLLTRRVYPQNAPVATKTTIQEATQSTVSKNRVVRLTKNANKLESTKNVEQ